MPADTDQLESFLESEFGDALRWVASFDAKTYDYTVSHVRTDLQSELTGNQLDFLIHRTFGVFSRDQSQRVYAHLGEANYLVAGYEKGTAYHLYTDEHSGVIVVLEPDTAVELPGFVEECRSHLDGD